MFARALLSLFCVTSLVLTGQAGLIQSLANTIVSPINILLGQKPPTPSNVSAEPRCILPRHPENGAYKVINMREARPGQGVVDAELEFTCMPGYALVGTNTMMCRSGVWYNSMPECLRLCEVERTSEGSIIVYRAGNAGTHRCLIEQVPEAQQASNSNIPASECTDELSRFSGNLPEENCEVPSHPRGGIYTVQDRPNALHGDVFDSLTLTVTCDSGYTVDKSDSVGCANGQWSGALPTCIRACQLRQSTSVEYLCMSDFSTSRACKDVEPSGTIVQPKCRPNYENFTALLTMHCTDGTWSTLPSCYKIAKKNYAECGISTGDPRISGGRNANRGEIPWHAGIYMKTSTRYKQICGGSLVTNTVVISAAHCFWNDLEKVLPSSKFAVAVGKLNRAWNDSRDTAAQKSDVENIIVSDLYQGNQAKFQDDIALVIVTRPFVYGPEVRRVCLDFDMVFLRSQLRDSSFGMVAGWGLTANGTSSKVLLKAQIPYINTKDCVNDNRSQGFTITSDKICAGYNNGTAVCRGDSGGGLAFPRKLPNGFNQYYLRGIASSAPPGENPDECNIYTWATFTNLNKHQDFITENFEKYAA